jgi:hypothetical protein
MAVSGLHPKIAYTLVTTLAPIDAARSLRVYPTATGQNSIKRS